MERIGREVERELARGGSRDAIPLAALTAAWPEVVGDAIARQAWPLRIARDGTLHVATSSATWANELGFLAAEILERLQARLGPDAPSRLRCAVGPVPEAAADEPEPTVEPPPDIPAEIGEEADSAASAIDDPELRELVARAARASLLKARSGRDF
ncbi:MAG: DciA family protein [Gaiellaceae bacterium]